MIPEFIAGEKWPGGVEFSPFLTYMTNTVKNVSFENKRFHMPQSVFVTGASGFLASHVILQLLEAGHRVRGSVRNEAKGTRIREVLAGHGADISRLEIVPLDLTEDAGWAGAMSGIETLIHTASPFSTIIPEDENEMIGPAVGGARRAVNAALEEGVGRIVLTSSEVAMARGHAKDNQGPFGEADWSDLDGPGITPYFKSKTLAEHEAWDIMEAAGRRDDLSVINPGFILGPLLEEDPGTSGALIGEMMKGGMPGAPNLYFSCVDVRDVAALHVLAMEDARAFGRRIPVSKGFDSFGDLADMLAAEFPQYARKLPTRRLPDFVVRLVSLVMKDARSALPLLGRKFTVEHAFAEELLGRALRETREAISETGRTLIKYGIV